MRTVLILTWILFPLLASSQTLNIDPITETVTLDKQKTIEVAKIIVNEERLSRKIDSLRSQLQHISDSLAILGFRYNSALGKIERLAEDLQGSQNQIQELQDKELKEEKKKRAWGLYGYLSLAGNQERISGTFGGLALARRRTLLTFTIDPFQGGGLIFQAGAGFRIF